MVQGLEPTRKLLSLFLLSFGYLQAERLMLGPGQEQALDCSQAASPAVYLQGQTTRMCSCPRVGFSPDLWSQHPSLGFVHSNALGTGGASEHWPMTTVRLPPMGQSTYWEKRPTTPGMSKRTARVCMSLWGGQEKLTNPFSSLGNAWLFKSTAKVAALHRRVESFRCHSHAGCAPGAKPARRAWLW